MREAEVAHRQSLMHDWLTAFFEKNLKLASTVSSASPFRLFIPGS